MKSFSPTGAMRPQELLVGAVRKFYKHIGVASVELTGDLKMNDLVHICGWRTDDQQRVTSMEINHEKVVQGKEGDLVGLKLDCPVGIESDVYRVIVED